jgi:hypothetical protein
LDLLLFFEDGYTQAGSQFFWLWQSFKVFHVFI